jgi:putative ABC transport system ATP-binding protein
MTDTTLPQRPDIVLDCRQVSKIFTAEGREPLTVLADVTFAVRRGEVALITGRSGAGKSTLMSLLAGLDRPTAGEVHLDDLRMDCLADATLANFRRARIGLIFQSFNLLPSWTAYENIEAALLHSRLGAAARKDKVLALMDSLGITRYADHLPAELSTGQQQRVAVARTLINNPSLILADEPTGDVDPETAGEILDLILAPVRAGCATMVVTTHGGFPPEVANSVYRLKDGILALQEAAAV